MTGILDLTFLGNKLYDWLIAIAIIVITFIVLRIFKFVIFKRLKKWAANTKTSWDEFVLGIIEKSALPLLHISIVYFALQTLSFGEKVTNVLHVAYMIILTFYIVKIIIAAFRKFVFSFIQRDEDSESKEKQAGGLIAIVNIIIWILGVVFLIDNMGYNVTTIVAGLGVGGIAIALAAQAVLGDLFSYFVIFFDRPFEIGDFVVIGDDNGIIEYIGIKTTRIRTLNGEQLICSNTDLTNSRLHNFKRMERRRIVFTLGVTYQTTAKQLASIPETVKEIILTVNKVSYDRGHFSGFGDFSLNFEFVYYVEDPEYNTYMDSQQAIYLAIFSAFEKQGIEFAYPTQTIQIDDPQSLFNPLIQKPEETNTDDN
ncbi:mechanosensitive ion channel family protein [Flavobacterium fluviatile]|uniref:mechanosensitive ion channel family protein n=1 Tax=Flavobacterium fluviatile TaxID=1862387 RepID=UPI0013D53C97|nr:mechanosensitive ion channel family protein [Flavobacterium fluviatile]